MRFFPACFLSIAWAVLTAAVRAQEEPVPTIPFEGPDVFCHILHSLDLKPIASLERSEISPEQTLIILFGQPSILQDINLETGGLAQFVKQGGNLLIATDYAMHVRDLPVAVTGRKRISEISAYRGSSLCPWLTYPAPDDGATAVNRGHPIFRKLQKGIATNCPSHLDMDEKAGIVPLLEFPRRYRPWRSRYIAGSPETAPPEGRTLFVAGHGMFMNGMMSQTDNDNFSFAVNAVQWLREAPSGKTRPKALFIVDGNIIADFNVSLSPPPPTPIPTVQVIDNLLRGLEDERFFHRLLAESIGEDQKHVVGLLFGITTFLLLLYGAKKLLAGRHQLETAVPSTVGPQAMVGLQNLILQQRQQALQRKSNFLQEARALVHEWFLDQFGVVLEQEGKRRTPELHIQAGWWRGRSLRTQVNYVMHVVHSDKAMKIAREDFLRLVRAFPYLNEAIKNNQLILLGAEK